MDLIWVSDMTNVHSRRLHAGPVLLVGATVIAAIALVRSPVVTAPGPNASLGPSAGPTEVANQSAIPAGRTIVTSNDLTHEQRTAVEGITIADVDETTDQAGRWVVVSGDQGWIGTDLPGESSSIRTTGRWLAAASEEASQWTVGLLDRSTGKYIPSAAFDPPGDWWVQASPSRNGTKIVAVGSGSRDGTAVDLGVIVVDVASGKTLVLTPEAPTKGFRSEIEWSASGDTVASSDCDMDVCRVDLVTNAESSDPRLVSIEGLTPLAVGDTVILGTDQRIDDRWRLVDVHDGTEAVAIEGSVITGAFDGYESTPGVFILSGRTEEGGFAIETYDEENQQVDLVFLQNVDDVYMYNLSQDPALAILTGRGGIVDVVNGRSSIGLVDLESGTFIGDALAVRPS